MKNPVAVAKAQLVVFNKAWLALWVILAAGDLVALFFIPFRWWFLLAFFSFGPCEGIGIFAKRSSLPPLTDVIREYVPEWLAMSAIFAFWGAALYLWNRPPSLVATFLMVGLLGWFTCHFIMRYLRPKSESERSMGWGEPRTSSTEVTIDTADKLADAVWEWKKHRSTGNEEKLIEALQRYERVRNRPSKGFLGC